MRLTYYNHEAEILARLPPRQRTGNYAKLLRIFALHLNEYEAALEELARGYSLIASSTPLFILFVMPGASG